MNRGFTVLAAASVLLASSCDEGANRDNACDESFEAHCLDAAHGTKCVDGVIEIFECAQQTQCEVSRGMDGGEAVAVSCRK